MNQILNHMQYKEIMIYNNFAKKIIYKQKHFVLILYMIQIIYYLKMIIMYLKVISLS